MLTRKTIDTREFSRLAIHHLTTIADAEPQSSVKQTITFCQTVYHTQCSSQRIMYNR
jgi:hypothetical protein